jgi:hypothetical protein
MMTRYELKKDLTIRADNHLMAARLSRLAGRAAEDIAIESLREEGFQVDVLGSYIYPMLDGIEGVDKGSRTFRYPAISSYYSQWPETPLSEELRHMKKFRDFCNEVRAFWYKSRNELKYDRGTMPDLIAMKEKELFIVEVKSGDARITPNELKVLQIAERRSFETLLIRMELSARIEAVHLYKILDL